LALAPGDPYYQNNRAYLHLLEDEDEKALPLINESITQDPFNGWAYRNKGYYFLKQGDAPEAIRLFERALKADSRIDKLHLWMAEALFLQGDRVKACEYLTEAAQRNQLT